MMYMSSIKTSGQQCGDRYKIISAVCLPILLLLFAVANIYGEEAPSTHFLTRDQEGGLSITSRKMILKNQENTILFEGDVVVERDSAVLKANNVEVMFTSAGGKENGGAEAVEKKRELFTITATGKVKFIQGVRTILADSVTYYKKEEKMVFTGTPNVREGQDELKGEKITVFIKEDRVIVEGGEAVIYPR